MGPRARSPSRGEFRPPRDGRPEFIRFVCFRLVDGTRCRLGLFQALEGARESDIAPDWALAELASAEAWFSENLSTPRRFSRGGRRGEGQPALSWFKPAAQEHIARMFQIKAALQACGVHVEVLRTREPGEILYEDDWQVTAEPGHRRF